MSDNTKKIVYAKQMVEDELKALLKKTNGKWFSAYVMTKKGLRRFHASTNVKRFDKGILHREEKANLVTVYDKYANGVRMIDVNNLKSFKCGKIEYSSDIK